MDNKEKAEIMYKAIQAKKREKAYLDAQAEKDITEYSIRNYHKMKRRIKCKY